MSATAKLVNDSRVRQRWMVTGVYTGKAYYADTYPGSDLLHIENAKTGRAVAIHSERHPLVKEIRQAIKDAQP